MSKQAVNESLCPQAHPAAPKTDPEPLPSPVAPELAASGLWGASAQEMVRAPQDV